MCNPRRVHCKATRKIAEAWKAEIRQAATARGDVTARTRLVQSVADLLPPGALLAFEQAMRASAEWVLTDGEYRRAVAGGYTAYRPDSQELEIVIQLSTAIEAVGTASLTETGEVTGKITAEGSGLYYTDNWRGHTRERALQAAQAEADMKADEMAQQRAAALKQQASEAAQYALSQRSGEVAEQAKQNAERQLTERAIVAQADLDAQASQQLELVEKETLKGIFQLVAAGYSAVLQAYALEHGENLEVSEEDGVIEIQFELER